jgi:hypothetical protein
MTAADLPPMPQLATQPEIRQSGKRVVTIVRVANLETIVSLESRVVRLPGRKEGAMQIIYK